MENAVYLSEALFDVINAIEVYENSGDPSTDLQSVILKLDYVQRLAVTECSSNRKQQFQS